MACSRSRHEASEPLETSPRHETAERSDGGVDAAGSMGGDLGVISVDQALYRIVYEPAVEENGPSAASAPSRTTNRAHGIDPEGRQWVVIDLDARHVSRRVHLVNEPSDLCVCPEYNRLFIVSEDAISELTLDDGELVRTIAWDARTTTDRTDAEVHYHIRCAGDRVFLVDGRNDLGLWELALDDMPRFVDRSAIVVGVDDLAIATDETLYFRAGNRIQGDTVWRVDMTEWRHMDVSQFVSNARETDRPLVLAERSGVIGAGRGLFDAFNLQVTLFTFAEGETVLAMDDENEVLATDRAVYGLLDQRKLVAASTPSATIAFFDRDGLLYFWDPTDQALHVQAP